MPSPFPGMDPYLEQPALWSSFHSRLIVAIADAIVVYLDNLARNMLLLPTPKESYKGNC
ncbi:MAG: DUF4058 family protein [Chroococcidiopsidaceae cyanobacterium CP_BM_RX_35]|nr:DUF4058 family protein [Chroococcidiopsidaceae cyanobacterium CP_BM_RX_35]